MATSKLALAAGKDRGKIAPSHEKHKWLEAAVIAPLPIGRHSVHVAKQGRSLCAKADPPVLFPQVQGGQDA